MEKTMPRKLAVVPTNDPIVPFRVLPLINQPCYSSLVDRVQSLKSQLITSRRLCDQNQNNDVELELLQVQASLECVQEQLESEVATIMQPVLEPFIRNALNTVSTLNQWALMASEIQTSLTTTCGFSERAVPHSGMVTALRAGNFGVLLEALTTIGRIHGILNDSEVSTLLNGKHIPSNFNEMSCGKGTDGEGTSDLPDLSI